MDINTVNTNETNNTINNIINKIIIEEAKIIASIDAYIRPSGAIKDII